uniref:Uncharacterized protein n=1 Tax=Ciona intestinalis TaxID=7719 RepID=H2XKH2_CIOIN
MISLSLYDFQDIYVVSHNNQNTSTTLRYFAFHDVNNIGSACHCDVIYATKSK